MSLAVPNIWEIYLGCTNYFFTLTGTNTELYPWGCLEDWDSLSNACLLECSQSCNQVVTKMSSF